MAGVQVAMIQDLNSAVDEWNTKFEEQRRWTETQVNDFLSKFRSFNDRIEKSDNNQTTLLESLNADVKGIQQKMVTNAVFKSQVGTIERSVEELKEEFHSQLDEHRKCSASDVQNHLAGIRGRVESCSATNLAIQEKMRVLEENTLPNMRSDAEEMKAKRLAEAQRLEAEIEKQKEVAETKIGHTAAALRFYVNALGTKLREELTPLTAFKETEMDVNQRMSELSMALSSITEQNAAVRTDLLSFKESTHHANEKQNSDINSATKMVKVMETTIAGFQSGVSADIGHVHETMKTDRAGIEAQLADARASTARTAAANEQNVQALNKELSTMKEKQALIIERLNIEKIVEVVRDWQTVHVPQTEAMLKDLEEQLGRVKKSQQQDHDSISQLSKATAAIKGHFKMFHAIATGLDGSPVGPESPKSRRPDALPPLTERRGGTPPDRG
jgi:hypothetical protein